MLIAHLAVFFLLIRYVSGLVGVHFTYVVLYDWYAKYVDLV